MLPSKLILNKSNLRQIDFIGVSGAVQQSILWCRTIFVWLTCAFAETLFKVWQVCCFKCRRFGHADGHCKGCSICGVEYYRTISTSQFPYCHGQYSACSNNIK